MTSAPLSPRSLVKRLAAAVRQRPHWAAFVFIYLFAFPYFSKLRSANEMPRIMLTQQIVDHGTFAIESRVPEMGSLFDTSRAPNGHLYPNKAPGPSFVAVPVYIVCKWLGATSMAACTWAFRVVTSTLPGLLFLLVFWRLLPRFTSDENAQGSALVAYGLGSPALPYALLFMSHVLAAVCAGAGFAAAVAIARGSTRRPFLMAIPAGALTAGAVMMDYQAVLAALGIGLYALACAKPRLKTAAGMAVGAAPVAAALAAYHTVCFGGPLVTGYKFAEDQLAHQGFLGLGAPSWASFNAILFEPANGLFVLAPWTVFALVGAVVVLCSREARARAGAETITCLFVFASLVLFLGCLAFARAGWSVGPRYLTVALPFIGWLAAPGFAAANRYTLTRVLSGAFILASVVVFVLGATVFPHWPENLKNPLHEFVLPLLASGHAVHSLGTAVGLHGVSAIAPMYVAALALTLALLHRRGRLFSTIAVCVLAGLLFASYRLFPFTGPYSTRALNYAESIWEPAIHP